MKTKIIIMITFLVTVITIPLVVKLLTAAESQTISVDETTRDWLFDDEERDVVIDGVVKTSDESMGVDLQTGYIVRNTVPEDVFRLFPLTVETANSGMQTSSSTDFLRQQELSDIIVMETGAVAPPSGVNMIFYDVGNFRPMLVLSNQSTGISNVFNTSLQVGKDRATTTPNATYNLCEGFSWIDCDSAATGSDLGVEDDIESKGSLYVGGTSTTTGNAHFLGDVEIDGDLITNGGLQLNGTSTQIISNTVSVGNFAYIDVFAESGTSDYIDTINTGGVEGQVFNLLQKNKNESITVRDGVGNVIGRDNQDCDLKGLLIVIKEGSNYRVMACIDSN